ncbi:hypothetical protein [Chamaesiphon sp. VAR_48_metabat_135_sub]|uniref:hypothetical protein n=1 Tax=Chamaesiphon sp. VAR_48_metabat_135_sub TaxID=2964699 RepID=UPI00286AA97C|nr:hypothetical protein [Chamaesiphon sp. VAR_48_metabat_135_sub]
MNQLITETKHNSLDSTGESFGYWQQKLVKSPPSLHLLTDKPRGLAITFSTENQNIYLPKKLLESLKTIAEDRQVDLVV